MTKIATTGPANFSIHAALAAGYLSHNTLVQSVNGKTLTVPATVISLVSTGLLDPSLPASVLGFSQYGGD